MPTSLLSSIVSIRSNPESCAVGVPFWRPRPASDGLYVDSYLKSIFARELGDFILDFGPVPEVFPSSVHSSSILASAYPFHEITEIAY